MNTTDTHTHTDSDTEPAVDRLGDGRDEPGDGIGAGPVQTVVRFAFVVSLVLFVVGGVVLVALQAVRLALGDGAGATRVAEEVGPPTYLAATVCGLLAFVQCYFGPGRGREQG